MSRDPDALRRDADRLRAEADEAEARSRRAAERWAAMKPEWRVADLLHRHFARTYPGAGGAMDGGDPWAYEVPTGHGAENRWQEAWSGSEHQRFVSMAENLAEKWQASMEQVEILLVDLAFVLKGYDAEAVRSRRNAYADHQAKRLRDEAVDAVEKALVAAAESARRAE